MIFPAFWTSYKQLKGIVIGPSRCLLQLWLVAGIALILVFQQSFENRFINSGLRFDLTECLSKLSIHLILCLCGHINYFCFTSFLFTVTEIQNIQVWNEVLFACFILETAASPHPVLKKKISQHCFLIFSFVTFERAWPDVIFYLGVSNTSVSYCSYQTPNFWPCVVLLKSLLESTFGRKITSWPSAQ